ncbi:hypothetical protein [Craterilacuibacter sp. RT1T]|uniref:hypothetical protein n=1 Tax=Craterilacuibacter sp. RT1T TaxID=2942211 RepID=UPI0020C09617|nr:hypothetical protein [Craterilacuibacter sp. RT1T]MCL6262326.1 hypothetical protein [Craterilacuibacter sp. RT1T]
MHTLDAPEGQLRTYALAGPADGGGALPAAKLIDGARYGLASQSPAAGKLAISVNPDADGFWQLGVEGPTPATGETLRFAVELSWEGGRWVRSYTVRTRGTPRAGGTCDLPCQSARVRG